MSVRTNNPSDRCSSLLVRSTEVWVYLKEYTLKYLTTVTNEARRRCYQRHPSTNWKINWNCLMSLCEKAERSNHYLFGNSALLCPTQFVWQSALLSRKICVAKCSSVYQKNIWLLHLVFPLMDWHHCWNISSLDTCEMDTGSPRFTTVSTSLVGGFDAGSACPCTFPIAIFYFIFFLFTDLFNYFLFTVCPPCVFLQVQ